MRTDQVACRAILQTLGLQPPDRCHPRAIHTRIILNGGRDRPDVRVRIGRPDHHWEVLIESRWTPLGRRPEDLLAGRPPRPRAFEQVLHTGRR
jgi:hypothetical protein